ncbi:MAG: hypothetical protein JXR91_09305, partial [Deltaproteobacteria bacterium]|nr:hypothetical protein [Deltaproteobacteria bacterium]
MFCHSIKYLYIQLLIFTILLNFAAGCSKHETEPSVAVKYDKNKDVYPDTYFWWKKLIFNSKYFEDKSTGLVNTGTGVHVYILDTGISSL